MKVIKDLPSNSWCLLQVNIKYGFSALSPDTTSMLQTSKYVNWLHKTSEFALPLL